MSPGRVYKHFRSTSEFSAVRIVVRVPSATTPNEGSADPPETAGTEDETAGTEDET